MHENHRKRVRERYIKNGFEGFADHNVLEMLLFYSIARKDTNELAHTLIATFGSLEKVFEAGYDRLMSVEGVGESTAVLLSMVPQLHKLCNENKSRKKIVLDDKKSITDFLARKFENVTEETLYLLCLDGSDVLINCLKIGEGNSESVSVRKKQLLECAFRCDAYSVILAHNHPNGIAAPSHGDVAVTLELIELFSSVGIALRDHYICAGNEIISMASTAKFRDSFI